MHILEAHIDGFGVFCDQHIRDFGDGVVLFVGPNEAGKSTLMSFISGVLFGFERKSQAGYYPPLSGGRHGGRLVVGMSDGEQRVVERYVGRGQPKDPVDVVGNMSKAIYSNVFAFGLSELASLESLGSEEVRARIYSAGAGLGTRSLPEARKVVLSNLDRLYKRQGRVPEINLLLREIFNLEDLIAGLASRPVEFNEVVCNIERLEEKEERIHRQLDAARSEHLWFMTLRATRGTWEQLRAARALLHALEEGDTAGAGEERDAIFALEPEIRRLKLQQESFIQLADSIPELEAVARERRRSYEERLRELGGTWDAEAIESVDVSPGVADEIRASRERIARQEAEVQRRMEVVGAKREAADEAESRLNRLGERIETSGKLEYDRRDDIVARIRQIDDAQVTLGDINLAEAEVKAAKGGMDSAQMIAEDKVAAVQSAKEEVRRRKALANWLPPLAVAVLSLFAALLMGRGTAMSFTVVLAGLCAAAIMTLSSLRNMRDADGKFEKAMAEAETAERSFKSCKDEHEDTCDSLRRLRREFDLTCSDLFGEEDIDASTLGLARDAARDDLATWDEIVRLQREYAQAKVDCERAEDEWKRARKLHKTALDELERLREEWRSWMSVHGMDPSFGHDAAERTIDAVRDARRAQQAAADAEARLEDAGELASRYVADVNEVMGLLGLEETDVDRACATVEGLVAMVEQAQADKEARTRAQLAVSELDAQFVSAFPVSDRKRAEEFHLSCTAEEIADLCDDAEERRQAIEAELKELAEEKGRLNEKKRLYENDDEIAEAFLELASAESRLAACVGEWAAYRLCLELLDGACDVYERERQPQVIRDASEALTAMTGGRWQSVIARVSGLDSLDVVDKNSRALSHTALSCGTEQQLYLAVRCGLVREYCSHAEPMPVMIDEALVNFDPERAEAAASVLADLTDIAQVLVFTCHPYMAECFRRTGRVTAEFELDGAEIRPLV